MTKNALLKRGPKISGMGRPLPPPSFRQCPKENVFFPLMSSLTFWDTSTIEIFLLKLITKNMLFEYRMSFTMPPFDLFSGVRNILLLRHSQLIFGRFSSSSVVQTFDKVLTSEKKLRELAQTCSSNISECSQPWVLSNETNYICIFVSACDFWKDDLTLWSDLKILENWKQIQDLDCSL